MLQIILKIKFNGLSRGICNAFGSIYFMYRKKVLYSVCSVHKQIFFTIVLKLLNCVFCYQQNTKNTKMLLDIFTYKFGFHIYCCKL